MRPKAGTASGPPKVPLMSRFGLAVLAGLVLAAPAAGDVYSRKHSVDARLSRLHTKIAQAEQRASALSAEINTVSSRIHALEGRVGDVSARLAVLEDDLALHRRKLDRLTALFKVETTRYVYLRHQYG